MYSHRMKPPDSVLFHATSPSKSSIHGPSKASGIFRGVLQHKGALRNPNNRFSGRKKTFRAQAVTPHGKVVDFRGANRDLFGTPGKKKNPKPLSNRFPSSTNPTKPSAHTDNSPVKSTAVDDILDREHVNAALPATQPSFIQQHRKRHARSAQRSLQPPHSLRNEGNPVKPHPPTGGKVGRPKRPTHYRGFPQHKRNIRTPSRRKSPQPEPGEKNAHKVTTADRQRTEAPIDPSAGADASYLAAATTGSTIAAEGTPQTPCESPVAFGEEGAQMQLRSSNLLPSPAKEAQQPLSEQATGPDRYQRGQEGGGVAVAGAGKAQTVGASGETTAKTGTTITKARKKKKRSQPPIRALNVRHPVWYAKPDPPVEEPPADDVPPRSPTPPCIQAHPETYVLVIPEPAVAEPPLSPGWSARRSSVSSLGLDESTDVSGADKAEATIDLAVPRSLQEVASTAGHFDTDVTSKDAAGREDSGVGNGGGDSVLAINRAASVVDDSVHEKYTSVVEELQDNDAPPAVEMKVAQPPPLAKVHTKEEMDDSGASILAAREAIYDTASPQPIYDTASPQPIYDAASSIKIDNDIDQTANVTVEAGQGPPGAGSPANVVAERTAAVLRPIVAAASTRAEPTQMQPVAGAYEWLVKQPKKGAHMILHDRLLDVLEEGLTSQEQAPWAELVGFWPSTRDHFAATIERCAVQDGACDDELRRCLSDANGALASDSTMREVHMHMHTLRTCVQQTIRLRRAQSINVANIMRAAVFHTMHSSNADGIPQPDDASLCNTNSFREFTDVLKMR